MNKTTNARKLMTLANYASEVLEELCDELAKEDDTDFCFDARTLTVRAIARLEAELSELRSWKGVPFREGRGAPAELDALVRSALRSLYAVRGTLQQESDTGHAFGWATDAMVELYDRLTAIERNRKRRRTVKAANPTQPTKTETGDAAGLAS